MLSPLQGQKINNTKGNPKKTAAGGGGDEEERKRATFESAALFGRPVAVLLYSICTVEQDIAADYKGI